MSSDQLCDRAKGFRSAWNNNKLIGPKPPLKAKEIRAIRSRLQLAKRTRDLALFNLAIDSKLRGCDLVCLRAGNLVHGGRVVARGTVVQCKTRQPVRLEPIEQTRDAVHAWIAHARLQAEGYWFPSRLSRLPHRSTRQYARIVKGWVSLIDLDPEEYGTHSLRRSKAPMIYRRTKNMRAVQRRHAHAGTSQQIRPRQRDNRKKRCNDDHTIAPDHCLECGVDGYRPHFSPDHVRRIRDMAFLRHLDTGPFRRSRVKPSGEP